jgi:hypothetical protein
LSDNLLPTGKPHVSYSEVRNWSECPYRHYLQQIKKINLDKPSEHLDFGTAVHAACEGYLKTRVMDVERCMMDIVAAWDSKGFPQVEKWATWAKNALDEVPAWLDETFPGWETVSAEEALYESIEDRDAYFKGFVDCVIKVPREKSGYDLWVLDWKTAGAGGWRAEKKQDPLTLAQIALYKSYLMNKHKDLYDGARYVKCGYVLLKKGAKPGKCVELFTVSVGPVAMQKANKLVSNTIAGMRKGTKIKNRQSCQYCPYLNTEHCT